MADHQPRAVEASETLTDDVEIQLSYWLRCPHQMSASEIGTTAGPHSLGGTW